MILDYRLIQYVANPDQGEGRNIGVIAHGNRKAYYRGLGVGKNGHVDNSYFQAICRGSREYDWVYGEWAAWFQTLAENEGKDPDQFDRLMRELEAQASGILARPGGLLELPDGEDPDRAMDWLYKQAVKTPKRSGPGTFTAKVEEILKTSGISGLPNFHHDVVIEFSPEGSCNREFVRLSYLLESTQRVAFKAVRLSGRQDVCLRQINDASYCFERAVELGFVVPDRCITLVDSIPSARETLLGQLRKTAVIADCSHEDAARDLIMKSLLSETR